MADADLSFSMSAAKQAMDGIYQSTEEVLNFA